VSTSTSNANATWKGLRTSYLPKTSSANKGYFPSSSTGGPARTIESQLIHFVIRLYSPWEARNLKMRHFVEGLLLFGFEVLKCNREKNKLRVQGESMVVDSYKPIFHLYANINTRTQKIIGINYPTHINVKYHDKPLLRVGYIVRDSEPLMFKGKLAIDGGPKGCKGYLEEVYNIIKAADPASPIRMCTCAKDRAAAKARKSARTERAKAPPRTVAGFLGLLAPAPAGPSAPAGPPECPHYLTGKCENFKIGGVCPFIHTGWDNSMISRCEIACDLPADINDTEQCINGVSCLYNHSM